LKIQINIKKFILKEIKVDIMGAKDVFGANAGKVWSVLKEKGILSVGAIAKQGQLKVNEVFAALGWLGREGKIQIINDKKGIKYKLIE